MKTKIFNCTLFIWLLFSSFRVSPQQDAQFTQYMYNANIINPAYAGTREIPNLTILHRSQWAGIDGAPETQTVNLNIPVGFNGVGLGFFKDFSADNIKRVTSRSMLSASSQDSWEFWDTFREATRL